MYLVEATIDDSRSSVTSKNIDNIQTAPNSLTFNIMQTIHKACLALTGVCVVILCVGIGIGIVHHIEVNSVDYEAYDEDYVGYDAAKENVTLSRSGIFGRSGVINNLEHDQVQG